MKDNFLGFTWQVVKPYRAFLIVAIIIMIIIGMVPVLDGILLKKLVNDLGNIHTFEDALFYILVYTAWWELASWLWRGYDFCLLKSVPKIRNKIIDETVYYLTGQSYSFLQHSYTGALTNKIADLNLGIITVMEIFFEVIVQKFTIIVSSIFCIYAVHPYLGYVLSIWLLIFIFINCWLAKYAHNFAQNFAEKRSNVFGIIVDIIGNINNIRMFSGRHYEREYLKRNLLEVKKSHEKILWFQIKGNYLKGLITSILIGIILAIMFDLKVGEHLITAGDFALVISIMIVLSENVWSMGVEINTFIERIGLCSKAIKSISVPYEVIDNINAKELVVTKGEIVFQEVSFRYANKNRLFYNKSVSIKGGEKVGLVGCSGSGKTTFVNLIIRLFDIESGAIYIDGQNISEVSRDSLYRTISFIPQEPILFHRSIADNIRYGKREATDEEVIIAAKKAHAHEFIEKVGYDSPVGERGARLSGGQRQRIAMARAFLKDSKILIMDEATSALDSITEKNIQASMEVLMQGKTVLVIAHRLSTLLNMDRILVFHMGKIVEEGKHTELLRQKGIYASLWEAQSLGV